MATIIVNPGQRIQSAINKAVSKDTIIVNKGKFNEKILIKNKSNITISSANNRGAIIDGKNISVVPGPAGYGQGLLQMDGCNNITIRGFNITNSTSSGIQANNSSNISITRNYINNVYSSGVQCHTSSNLLIDSNEIYLAANAPNANVQEIISLESSSYYEIKNNNIHDGGKPNIGGEGIDVKVGSSNGTIHDNIVKNLNATGIYSDAYDNPNQHDIKIYNNFCQNTGWNGIAVSGEQGGTLSNVEIYNNVCTGCDTGIAIPAYDEVGAHLNTVNVHNNTIYKNNYGMWIGYYNPTKINGLIIKDNILDLNNLQSYSSDILWQNRNNDTNVIIDHNYFDTIKSVTDYTLGTNYIVGGDPLFVDPINGNFQLQNNSPAIGFGAYPS